MKVISQKFDDSDLWRTWIYLGPFQGAFLVPASVDKVVLRYGQLISQFVFDASALEGNPFTYPEVKTLFNGVTLEGHKLSDQQAGSQSGGGGQRPAGLRQGWEVPP